METVKLSSQYQLVLGPAGEDGATLILVDSSDWIEYLADRPRADQFARYIEADSPYQRVNRQNGQPSDPRARAPRPESSSP